MQFRPPPEPEVRAGGEPDGPLQVTVSVRWTPLVTAPSGTQVARYSAGPATGNPSDLRGDEGESYLSDRRLARSSRHDVRASP
jgi:hypothetical protein